MDPVSWQVFDTRLADLFAPDAQPQAMPGGYDIGGGDTAGWGRGCDGPVWVAELGALAFSDIAHHRRLTWAPGAAPLVLHEATGAAVGAARDPQGRFIACEWETRRVTRRELDGAVTVLAERFDGRRLNRPDDLVLGPDGSIYFTDLRISFPPPDPEAAPGSAVYRILPDGGTVERAVSDLDTPGGLALSPDARTLYVADTGGRRLMAYDIGFDGSVAPGSGRTLASLAGEAAGAPHGLCVDRSGNLYCGGAGGLWVMAPDGKALGVLRLPASRVTNVAFGGADGDVLFITTTVGVGCIASKTRGLAATTAPALAGAKRHRPRFEQGIERHDAALDRIIPRDAQIANLASGGFFDDLGGGLDELYSRSLEGTFWSAEENCLFFSDIGNSRRMRWDRDGCISQAHRPTGHTNGATLDLEGLIVSCEHSERRVSRRQRDGSRTTLADRVDGKRLNHPNDVVVRSDGAMVFTDPWWDFGAGQTSEIGYPGVYHVSPDLKTVTLVGKDYRVPNGLAFSPDETILYVNDSYGLDDSYGPHIRAYDVLPDGSIDRLSSRIFCRLGGERHGKPDGMKVDRAGNVYCGGSGGLWIIDPSGKHLGTIVHGATQTNNLAFGGDDWKTLFFVSWTSLHSVPLLVPGMPVPARAHSSDPGRS